MSTTDRNNGYKNYVSSLRTKVKILDEKSCLKAYPTTAMTVNRKSHLTRETNYTFFHQANNIYKSIFKFTFNNITQTTN